MYTNLKDAMWIDLADSIKNNDIDMIQRLKTSVNLRLNYYKNEDYTDVSVIKNITKLSEIIDIILEN